MALESARSRSETCKEALVDWQSLGLVTGASACGAAGWQLLRAAYARRWRKRTALRQNAQRRETFDRLLQTELQWARAAKPRLRAWTGARTFTVAAVVDEAEDCKSYYLVPADGQPLPRYEPGQFLTFRLPVDPRQKPLIRCYSLSDRPREDYYRVTVKQARPPRGQHDLPLGVGSSFFHQRVRVGSRLEAQAPQGTFFLDPTDASPVVLIGAGIGITPILSMLNTLVHERPQQAAHLFCGFGNSNEHPFRQHLEEVVAEHANVTMDVSYSRPLPSDQITREYDHRGYVDIARIKQLLPSNNFRFFVCGPSAMMEALVPALKAWGVPESHIHFEAFGPASVQSLRPSTRSEAEIARGPCQVEFLLANATAAWDGGCDSLLEFAESEGIPLDYGCRAGNCGQCLVSVKAGTVEHVKEPGMPLDEHQCLTCIGVPRGNVVLEA